MEGSPKGGPGRRAGQYARERYERGLRRFRRRFYREVALVLAAVAGAELGLAIFLGTFAAWLVFTFVLGAVSASIWILRQQPPDHIRRWGDGAWGEQQTAKALAPLERLGWRVEHDIELDRGGNIDHFVEAPSRDRFVLETKTLNGSVRVENGVLVCEQIDDEEQVFRHTRLKHAVLERARLLYRERPGKWVQAIVVILGRLRPAARPKRKDPLSAR
jgi:hypothetical protein